MRRVAKVDRNQSAIVETLRAVGIHVAITSPLGGGFPDLVTYSRRDNLVRLVEVKDGKLPPSARKLTEMEEAFARLFPVCVVNDEREALAAHGFELVIAE